MAPRILVGTHPCRPKTERYRVGVRCPVCEDKRSVTLDSRGSVKGDRIRRRRVCINGHRYTTHETVLAEQELAYIPDWQI